MSAIRPRFSHLTDLDPVEVQRMLVTGVKRGEGRFEVKNFPGFTCLRIAEEDRHFWSPRLILAIDPTEDGRTEVVGIYGPNANVWAIFLYSYLLTGSFGLFSGILGLVQWRIGSPPWGFWIFGVALAVAIGLYVSARCGQKIGAEQTHLLHEAYEAAVGSSAEVH